MFTEGDSQAVRIPKAFHISAERVLIQRDGSSLVLIPIEDHNEWPVDYIDSSISDPADETFVRHPQGDHREIPAID